MLELGQTIELICTNTLAFKTIAPMCMLNIIVLYMTHRYMRRAACKIAKRRLIVRCWNSLWKYFSTAVPFNTFVWLFLLILLLLHLVISCFAIFRLHICTLILWYFFVVFAHDFSLIWLYLKQSHWLFSVVVYAIICFNCLSARIPSASCCDVIEGLWSVRMVISFCLVLTTVNQEKRKKEKRSLLSCTWAFGVNLWPWNARWPLTH